MWKILTMLLLFVGYAEFSYSFPKIGLRGWFAPVLDSITPKMGETIRYTTSLSDGNGHLLQIKTSYLYDTAYFNDGWPTEQNQVAEAQEMIFKYNDSVLRIRPFHVRRKSLVRFGKKITLLDNVIFGISLIAGTKGSFYKIRGYGGCGSCSSYTGYYSLKGELLFENYFSDGEGFVRNIGNYKSVWKQYGVPSRRAKTPDIKEITVFPPANAGKIDQTYIL